jgi:chromosome segregation ATPase
MLDEKDVREEVSHVLSEAYDGKDWCEDGSIRQDIKDLRSNIVDIDDNIETNDSDINMLKLKVDNNLSVLARHSLELSEAALEIGKLNKKIDVLVESIADIDSLETLKKKLDVLNIKGDNGWMQK